MLLDYLRVLIVNGTASLLAPWPHTRRLDFHERSPAQSNVRSCLPRLQQTLKGNYIQIVTQSHTSNRCALFDEKNKIKIQTAGCTALVLVRIFKRGRGNIGIATTS